MSARPLCACIAMDDVVWWAFVMHGWSDATVFVIHATSGQAKVTRYEWLRGRLIGDVEDGDSDDVPRAVLRELSVILHDGGEPRSA